MSLAPGQTLGRYRLLEYIGRGGMGEVYRAHDTRFDRDVAIKSMWGHAASNPELLLRFTREVADAPRVVHPYVATVFDVVEHEGAPLLVMEYVRGRRFDAVIREDRPSLSKIALYGQEIAEALVAIHEVGIVHRDLKPGNVMVTDSGHVKVMDFGVAGRTPSTDPENATTLSVDGRLTVTGGVVGTPAYMSPEQVRGRETDGRSDLFALGIMLFEAVTGHHPFAGGTAAETTAAILHSPPGTGADRRRLKKSGALGKVIQALLEKDPAARPHGAAEAARRLREASADQADVVKGKDRLLRLALIAAGVLIAVAIAGYLAWDRVTKVDKRPPPQASSPLAVKVPGTRPAVAVLPFESHPDPSGGEDPGAMVADLLSATVGESGRLRSIPPDRIDEVLSTAKGPARGSAGIDRIQKVLAPEWVVTGTLYREEGELLATVRLYRNSGEKEAGSFRVQAARASELAQKAAVHLMEATGTPMLAGFAVPRPVRRFATSDDAQLLERDARRLAVQSDYVRAIAQLEKAIKLDPGFVDAHVRLAPLLEKVGYESRGRETIQTAMRLIGEQGIPADSRQALQAAAVQGRMLKLSVGLESLKRLAQLYPDEPDIYLDLAAVLNEAGNGEGALAAVDRAAALDPQDVRPLRVRAGILVKQKRFEEAHPLLDEAERRYQRLGLGAGLAEIKEKQAYLKYSEGRFEEAGSDYRVAGKLFREANLPIWALGEDKSVADMNVKLYRLDEAEAEYRRVLPGLREAGCYSDVVNSLTGLGAAYLRFRRMDEAERTLREADAEAQKLGNEQLRLGPLINLASVHAFSGRPREAVIEATKALEIAESVKELSDASSARELIASAAGVEGRLEEAARSFRELAEAEREAGNGSRQGYLLGLLAEIEEQGEQPGEALKSVNQSIGLLEPSSQSQPISLANRYACRARILALLGRHEEAAADLASAENLFLTRKDLPQVRDTLARTRATLDLMRGKVDAVLVEVSAELVPAERRSASRSPAEILRAQAQLLSGDALHAEAAARRTEEHSWTSTPDRAVAGLVRAQALARIQRSPEALKEARAVLAAGEKMGLPLTQAGAAALMLRLDSHSPEAARIGQRGRKQLQRYLDAIPPDARDAVRARFDIKEALEALGR